MTSLDLTTRYTPGPAAALPKRGWAIHHSAGPEEFATFKEEIAHLDWINRFHKEKRGFTVGIGYHVCVFASGNSYTVGALGTIRAHIAEQNHLYDGLCFIGTFSATHLPTDAALAAAQRIISKSGKPISGGHGELALGSSPTTCPGGWDTDLIMEMRPPVKPPFADTARRFAVTMAVALKQTPLVPHDIQEQDGKLYDRYIVRVPRA